MKKILQVSSIICLASASLFASPKYTPQELKEFEVTGTCIDCDLSNSFIRVNNDVQPPFNLEGSNISEATLQTGNSTSSNLSKIRAIKTNFGNTVLTQVNFKDAVLIDADMSQINLMDSDFEGANLDGVNFAGANLYGAKNIDFTKVKSICNAILPDGSRGEC